MLFQKIMQTKIKFRLDYDLRNQKNVLIQKTSCECCLEV